MSSRVFEILQTKSPVLVSRTKPGNFATKLENVNLYEETRHDEFSYHCNIGWLHKILDAT